MNDARSMTLSQHGFVLFLSIVISLVVHFILLFFCNDVFFSSQLQVDEERKALEALFSPTEIASIPIESLTALPRQQATADATPAITTAVPLQETVQQLPYAQPPMPALQTTLPANVEKPLALPESYTSPRQEIATIPLTPLTLKTNPEPRWKVEVDQLRVSNAPDIALSAQTLLAPQLPQIPSDTLSLSTATLGGSTAGPQPLSLLPTPELVEALPMPLSTSTISPVYAIDDRLDLKLSTYTSPRDPQFVYYQLTIQRKAQQSLPILSKDVVFIQDVSASTGGRRMAICKQALKSALYNTLRIGDRFNVFAFRDNSFAPSTSWLSFTAENLEKAESFIESFRTLGSTDLFRLLSDLTALKEDPLRPLIAVIITDGAPTTGITETTRIIGEFSRINQGRIAIYTFGIDAKTPYFLDMLCYTNRGENTITRGQYNTMAMEISPVFNSIRNPILKHPTLRFPTMTKGDIHPQHLTDLFADRPLTVYGRIPKSTPKVICQLQGTTHTTPYDAVFSFTLAQATRTEVDLRKRWAECAMFDLLADYAANPSKTLLNKIHAHATIYGVTNPYAPKVR